MVVYEDQGWRSILERKSLGAGNSLILIQKLGHTSSAKLGIKGE